jgi:hypothetical protein
MLSDRCSSASAATQGCDVASRSSTYPGFDPPGSCGLASAKVRWGSLAEPNVGEASFRRNDSCAKTGVLGPQKYPAPKPPSGPFCWGSVCLRGVPTAAGYARRRGRVIRDVKRGLWPLPSRSRVFEPVLPRPASRPLLAGLGTCTH